jgi:hypothetical protein
MFSICCHFNDYSHKYDYVIINMTTNMIVGDYDYKYDYNYDYKWWA